MSSPASTRRRPALTSTYGPVIGTAARAAVHRGGAAPGTRSGVPASDAVSTGRQLMRTTGAGPGTALTGCRR